MSRSERKIITDIITSSCLVLEGRNANTKYFISSLSCALRHDSIGLVQGKARRRVPPVNTPPEYGDKW